MRPRRSRAPQSDPSLQDTLREAMPRLASAWDSGFERVALIVKGEPPRFIERADAIARLGRIAAVSGTPIAVLRDALASPSPGRIDCIVERVALMRIAVDEFERYLSGDFRSRAPDAEARFSKGAADPEFASALIDVTAEDLPGPEVPALRQVAEALRERPSDVAGILSLLREAIVACRPFYGTTAGQNMGMVLNAILRATEARLPPKAPDGRPAVTLPKLKGDEHFADALEAARYPLAMDWDGGFERVAFVEPDGDRAVVQYVSRDAAVKRMFELASRAEDARIAEACRTEGTLIAKGPRPNRVDCVILGWGGQALVYLDPDVLRSTALEARHGDDEERNAIVTGPLDIGRMRRFLTGRGLVNAARCDEETVISAWHKSRSGARGIVDDEARRESMRWLEERGYEHFADDLRPPSGKGSN